MGKIGGYKMKRKVKAQLLKVFFMSVVLFLFACNAQRCLQNKKDKLIVKLYKDSDTIYLYTIPLNDFNLVWYHKNGLIYSFEVHPYKTKKLKPVCVENIVVNSDSIGRFFGNPLYKDIDCFDNMLDGSYIVLFVKNHGVMSSGVDMECLFKNRYPSHSFPYKLQYDISRIWKINDFDFEKMYSDE